MMSDLRKKLVDFKESVVLKENVEEVNKIVKGEVMKTKEVVDSGNLCNTQYVSENMIINPKKKANNVLA
ncbi:unnamed protein product [Lathyrus oleraceus]